MNNKPYQKNRTHGHKQNFNQLCDPYFHSPPGYIQNNIKTITKATSNTTLRTTVKTPIETAIETTSKTAIKIPIKISFRTTNKTTTSNISTTGIPIILHATNSTITMANMVIN